ncbi:MAG TPA: sulfotransferase [Acidimicrobiales bacterium]|nr:sulfotransferase [Acidimicrobiales bacterium]
MSDPIFVTGPDRSGTSLMYALLASHPRVSMVRRTNMWRWFYGRYGDLSAAENLDRCLDAMVRYRRMAVLEIDPARVRREFAQGVASYGRLFSIVHEHRAQRVGKPRWGDKSLHAEHSADDVFAEFPHARMIHLLRDPRDRHASISKRYQDRTKGVSSTTASWISSTRAGQRNERQFRGRYLIVRYEDLARSPESTMRAVCEFVDEPYEASILTMSDAPDHSAIGGNSSFGQFEPGAISTRSIGRYRSVVSPADVAFIQRSAGRFMDAQGYAKDDIEMTAKQTLRFCADMPINTARLSGWLASDAWQRRRGATVPASRMD